MSDPERDEFNALTDKVTALEERVNDLRDPDLSNHLTRDEFQGAIETLKADTATALQGIIDSTATLYVKSDDERLDTRDDLVTVAMLDETAARILAAVQDVSDRLNATPVIKGANVEGYIDTPDGQVESVVEEDVHHIGGPLSSAQEAAKRQEALLKRGPGR